MFQSQKCRSSQTHGEVAERGDDVFIFLDEKKQHIQFTSTVRRVCLSVLLCLIKSNVSQCNMSQWLHRTLRFHSQTLLLQLNRFHLRLAYVTLYFSRLCQGSCMNVLDVKCKWFVNLNSETLAFNFYCLHCIGCKYGGPRCLSDSFN